MKMFIQRHKIAATLAGSLSVLLLIALAGFNWLFEETGVPKVKSIAHNVGAASVLGVFAHPDDEQQIGRAHV